MILRRVLIVAIALAANVAHAIVPGSITVAKVSGAWVVYKPDGSVLSTTGTTTFGIQEALTEQGTSQAPLRILCTGINDPFIFPTGTTLTVPPGQALIEAKGCTFHFYKSGAGGNGLVFDTRQNSRVDFGGSQIYCSGCWNVVLLQPQTQMNGVYWSVNSDYDFGVIAATGSVSSLLTVNVASVAGIDQPSSSQFVLNRVKATLEGAGFTAYNFRYSSPVNLNQAGGENTFTFPQNQGATVAEMYLGTIGGNILDQNLGTNKYEGNIAHTGTASNSYAIITNVPWDYYDLRSLNIYNPGPQWLVYFGYYGCKNVIHTTQFIQGSLGAGTGTCPTGDNVLGPP